MARQPPSDVAPTCILRCRPWACLGSRRMARPTERRGLNPPVGGRQLAAPTSYPGQAVQSAYNERVTLTEGFQALRKLGTIGPRSAHLLTEYFGAPGRPQLLKLSIEVLVHRTDASVTVDRHSSLHLHVSSAQQNHLISSFAKSCGQPACLPRQVSQVTQCRASSNHSDPSVMNGPILVHVAWRGQRSRVAPTPRTPPIGAGQRPRNPSRPILPPENCPLVSHTLRSA